jgi:hypothetical protein
LWPRGNPTDASGAFRPGPRAPTEASTPFFQNSKLIPKFLFGRRFLLIGADHELLFVVKNRDVFYEILGICVHLRPIRIETKKSHFSEP